MTKTKNFGWFSQKMADFCGFAIYLDAHGNRVMVTTVVSEELGGEHRASSTWGDETFRGEVFDFVSSTYKTPEYEEEVTE